MSFSLFFSSVVSSAAVDDCQWGPSFWCQSIENAETCQKVDYCKDKVWKVRERESVCVLLYNLTCTVLCVYFSYYKFGKLPSILLFAILLKKFMELIKKIVKSAKFAPRENFALYGDFTFYLLHFLKKMTSIAYHTCNVHVTKVILKLRDGRSYYVCAHAIMVLACTAHVLHVLANGYDIHWQLFVFFLFCPSCDACVCVCVFVWTCQKYLHFCKSVLIASL